VGGGNSDVVMQISSIMAKARAGPGAQFHTILYNHNPKKAREINGIGGKHPLKPANLNPKQWRKALLNNPDPENLVPFPVNSFAELKRRIDEGQKPAFNETKEKIKELKEKIQNMKIRHENTVEKDIPELKMKQSKLAHRLLKIMSALERMRAQRSRSPLMSKEIDYLKQLIHINRELKKPTQFKAKVEELDSIVRIQEDLGGDSSLTLDSENLDVIQKFLKKQTKGLKYLSEVLRKGERDLGIIERGLEYGSERPYF